MDDNELEATLRSLAARVEALEAENARLRAAAAPEPPGVVAPVSRRDWLARGATVAAGAVVGSVAGGVGGLGGVGPVEAATGPITMNQNNDADTWTRLSADVSAPNTAVLQVWNLSTLGGAGVQGIGATEGVLGSSSAGLGGWFYGAAADVRLGNTRVAAPPGDAVGHVRGEIVFVNGLSSSGEFWACVQTGTPGVWRRLTGSTGAGSLTVLSAPVRVYDSRTGQAPTAIGPKTPLANGVDRVVDTSGNFSGVPSDATAVMLSLTAVNQNGSGWLSVRADGAAYGGHSNLNFQANTAIATMCLSRCSGSDIAVRLGGAATSCNVAVDVLGYYR